MGKRRRGRRGRDGAEAVKCHWSGDDDPSPDLSGSDTDPPDASSTVLPKGVTQQRLLPEDDWWVERWVTVSTSEPCGEHPDARHVVGHFRSEEAAQEEVDRCAFTRVEPVFVLTSRRRHLGRGHRLETDYLRAEDVVVAERHKALVASAHAKLTDAEWEAVLRETLRRR